MMLDMKFFKDKGFTTIELMMVIIIVAVLLVIAVPNFLVMSNRNAVVAATNELVGLIQYTKNYAKIANKPTVLRQCGDGESCSMAAIYAEDKGATDRTLRVITFPKNIHFSSSDSSASGDKQSIAFYMDGTRGVHATNSQVSSFKPDGSLNTNINLSDYATGDVTWQISAGNTNGTGYYCRAITISLVGDVKVKEGCLK